MTLLLAEHRVEHASGRREKLFVRQGRGVPLPVVHPEDGSEAVASSPAGRPRSGARPASRLGEVRSIIGERRVAIVFDRGGYSHKLFAQLIVDRFDVLTYRKGRTLVQTMLASPADI
jgi:hypothetical protein